MCDSDTFPRVSCSARVLTNREISPMVFSLVISRSLEETCANGAAQATFPDRVPSPLAGQFFMLRARPSGVLLGRPISVYLSDDTSITFLILKKGRGTAELCALRQGDVVDIVGPIGNRFVSPEELSESDQNPVGRVSAPRIAIIGGGIGVAPVAGFALTLKKHSFDFYASFRSAPYGIDLVSLHAKKLIVTTEDGSAGVKGMLPAVFDPALYDLVYACGPTPMLRYIQSECKPEDTSKKGPLVFLSLEQHMACGAGACLGCTIKTVNGNRRCCVDGPVFNATEVLL